MIKEDKIINDISKEKRTNENVRKKAEAFGKV